MDKKDLENLSEQELAELKDSIDEAIESKKYKKSYANTNTKGIAICLLYTSPSPRDLSTSRMPSSA